MFRPATLELRDLPLFYSAGIKDLSHHVLPALCLIYASHFLLDCATPLPSTRKFLNESRISDITHIWTNNSIGSVGWEPQPCY